MTQLQGLKYQGLQILIEPGDILRQDGLYSLIRELLLYIVNDVEYCLVCKLVRISVWHLNLNLTHHYQ